MSLFYRVSLPCPACQEPVEFQACGSVNADRRPDLRDEILSGQFQRGTCEKCATSFQLDPEFVYLDVGRNQWIAVYPVSRVGEWEQLEKESREVFDRTYGAGSTPDARDIGRELRTRLAFGWSALREKLLLTELGLDDVNVELLKTAMLGGMENPPLAHATELRLVSVDAEESELVLASLVSQGEEVLETLRIPRALYDDIAADQEDWNELRAEISAGYFVDIRRLIVSGKPPSPAAS